MKSLFSALFLIFPIILFSQSSKNLSEKEYIKLQKEARRLIGQRNDSAFILLDKIENSNNSIHRLFAIAAKGYFYLDKKDDSVTSRAYINKAFIDLDKIPLSQDKIRVNAYLYNYAGLCEFYYDNLDGALEYYLKCEKLAQEANDLVQIVKVNNNISRVYSLSKKDDLAIPLGLQSLKIIAENRKLYTEDEYRDNLCGVYMRLSSAYTFMYYDKGKSKKLIDSMEYYSKKSFVSLPANNLGRFGPGINLSNVYIIKKEFAQAEKILFELLDLCKKINHDGYYPLFVNFGELYFEQKNYDKALIYFQKNDSIFKTDKLANEYYVWSVYYLAKIYNLKGNAKRALYYSERYLKASDEMNNDLNHQIREINEILQRDSRRAEVLNIKNQYTKELSIRNVFIISAVILILILIFWLLKNRQEKKAIKRRIDILINEIASQETIAKKAVTSLSINEEKEVKIVKMLNDLEDKLTFLRQDFTQQFVAKKIKTNTAYLSYVVNKKFGKTFSEYTNDLKINYVMNKLIKDPTFRNYSTQAIAESAGFKNGNSFASSFKKKTNVTPYQFITEINNRFNQQTAVRS
jgi:AraC-like DNA-binding protein